MSSASVAILAAEARAPKRERGRARVSAILDAGAAVLVDKGYDAATMTEIAARSHTAIGSLYRFFPTKAALADAILARHATAIDASLAALESRATGMSVPMIVDTLVEFMLERTTDRDAAVALVDVCPGGANRRAQIREAARRGIAAILSTIKPALPAEQAADTAAVVLQMLKGARSLAEMGTGPLAGLRQALRLYLADCVGSAP